MNCIVGKTNEVILNPDFVIFKSAALMKMGGACV